MPDELCCASNNNEASPCVHGVIRGRQSEGEPDGNFRDKRNED